LTSLDRELDPKIFGAGELILYRIARAKYANLSGVGAAKYPGRWNVLNQEAIYTSCDTSTPVLEKLAHLSKDTIPKNQAMMQLVLKGDWQVLTDSMIDHETGAVVQISRSLRAAEAIWPRWETGSTIALAVPSVIVPAWNMVLFPDAPQFWQHVYLGEVEPFDFDPRLFSA